VKEHLLGLGGGILSIDVHDQVAELVALLQVLVLGVVERLIFIELLFARQRVLLVFNCNSILILALVTTDLLLAAVDLVAGKLVVLSLDYHCTVVDVLLAIHNAIIVAFIVALVLHILNQSLVISQELLNYFLWHR